MSPFHTLRSIVSLTALPAAVVPVAAHGYVPAGLPTVPRAEAVPTGPTTPGGVVGGGAATDFRKRRGEVVTGANADTVELSVDKTSVNEDGGAVTVTVTATANNSASSNRTVRVSVGRSGDAAAEGTDYKTVWDLDLTIGANATTATTTFSLEPIDDTNREHDERISVYGALASHTVTGTSITIKSNDRTPEISASFAGGSVAENGSAKTFTVHLTAPDKHTPATVTVMVGNSGDGATEGTDYETVADFTITIPYQSSGASGSFTITPKQDTDVEGNESISVALSHSSKVVESPFGLTLTDDDATSIALSASPSSVNEKDAATSVTVTATAAKALSAASTVTVEVGGSGSAGYLTDYSLNDYDFDISIAAGQTVGTGTFTLTPTQDAVVEGDETVGLSGRTTGHSVTGTTLTLNDDESDPSVNLSVSSSSISEGTSKGTVTVTAAFSSSVTYTVDKQVTVSVGKSGTATSGKDYTAVSDFTVTIPKGKTTSTAGPGSAFVLVPTDDTVFEGDETIVVSGTSSGLTVNNDTITITDNDDAAVTVGDAKADEGDSITFTVTLDKAVQGGLTVTPGYTNGTAASGDYTENTAALTFAGTAGETETFKVATVEDTVFEADETFKVGLTVSDAPPGVTATDSATGTIENDESAAVTIGDAEASEGDSITFTVTLDVAVQGGLTVTPGYTDGTTSSGDYTENTAALSFDGTAGETETFKVATVQDAVFEADETFRVGLAVSDAPSGVAATDSATGTIENDESAAVTVEDAKADEGDSITFTVTLDVAVQGGLTVTPGYTDGTTSSGDYTENTAALSFDGTAGETETFKVATEEDAVFEADETFRVGLTVSDAPSGVTATDSATATIENDESAAVTVGDAEASEGDSIEFTVTLDVAVQGGLTVTPDYANGTAASGDYTENTAALTFAGTAGETETFKVATEEDAVFEADETFTVGLTVSDAPSGVTATDTGTGTIENDESAAVTIEDAEASEGDSIEFTVTLDVAVQGGLTVTPDYTNGTAASGDYTENTAALTFAGTAGETETFKVATEEDAVFEADETFTVGLTVSNAPSGVTDTDTGTGTIGNDESAAVTVEDAKADEGDSIEFTVTLDVAVQGGLTVTPDYENGTAASGDYTENTAALTFAGTAGETETFKVATVEDVVFEADETFTVGLTVSDAPSGVTDTDTGTGTIENDESAAVTVADASASEGDAITFTVTLDNAVQDGLMVTPDFTNGTAGSGDYTVPEKDVVLGFAGTADETKTFTVATVEDVVFEADETFTVGLTVSSGPSGITDTDTGTGTIENDESAAVTIGDASADEGDSIAFTVTLDVAVQGGLTVTPDYTNGTAATGDYTENTAALTFAGTAGETETFRVATVEDAVFEADETFTVGLTVSDAPSGVTDTDTGTGTIDNDESAAVTIGDGSGTGSGASASEGDSIEFTVTLDNAVQGGLTITPSYTNGTAGSGDYTENTTALTFAGTAGETETFKVATVEDAVFEADETFTVAVTVSDAPDGVTVSGTLTGTIENDESAAVTVADASASEGDSIEFTVTLDVAVQGGLTVTPGFANGTAAAGDYTENTTALSFAGTADETQTFRVATVEDAVFEADETFTVDLTVSDAPPGVTDTDTGTGTIDNDESAAVTVADANASEGDSIEFTVTLDNAVQGGLTVRPGFTDGTAAGTDYTENPVVLGFAGRAGETETFRVATTEDVVFEADETFTVDLTVSDAPPGVTDTDTGTGTIDNDESAAVTIGDAGADEGDAIEFTLTLDNAVQGGLKVRPGYANGTAASGDYTVPEKAVVLSFAGTADETRTFRVATVEDVVFEADETFTVDLTVFDAPPGVTDTDTGTGTIGNDESAAVTIGDASASEGDAIEFTVTLDNAVQGGLTVTPGYVNGTAAGSDYVADTAALDFAGTADETKTFRVATVEDAVFEWDETFTVDLTVSDAPPGVTDTDGGVGTIGNDDAAPDVELGVAPSEVAEGASATLMTVEAAFAGADTVGMDIVVTVAVGEVGSPRDGDAATPGTDYEAVPDFEVRIARGTLGAGGTFTLTPVQDAVVEGDETIGVTGRSTGLAVAGAEVTLTDDDLATATLSVDPAEVSEGAPATEVTVTLTTTGTAREASTVPLRVTGNTATAGEDFEEVPDFALTIPAGAGSGTATFTLTPIRDGFVEGDETIGVTASVPGSELSTEMTLVEDDTEPEVDLTVDTAGVAEGASATEVTVTAALSNASRFLTDTTVVVSVGGGTATAGADYEPVSDFGITIAKGTGRATGTFTLAPEQDDVVEGNERVEVTGVVAGLVVNGAEVELLDDDEVPEVVLAAHPEAVGEEASATVVTVTAEFTNGSVFPVDTTVVVSVGGGTATEGVDHAAVGDFEVVIAAGETGGTGTFTLAPVQDSLAEGDESVVVSGVVEGLVVGGGAVVMLEDDEFPEVELGVDLEVGTVGEGSSATVVTVTVVLSGGALDTDTAFVVSVGGGTATAGEDYVAVADFRIVIAAGETRGTGTFTLAPSDDNVVEGDETLWVTGAAPGMTVHGTEVTLADDDEVPEVELGVEPGEVDEGSAAVEVTVTAAFSNGSAFAEDTAVVVSVGGGTATAGEDYAAVADLRVVVAAGDTSGTGTFTLAPVQDGEVEGEETVPVSGVAPGLVVHGAEVALADDDEVPEVVLGVGPGEVAEGSAAVEVTVTAALSNGGTLPEDTTVVVGVGGGTAAVGEDYAAVGDFGIVIPAGGTSGTGTFTLAPVQDDVVEGGETVLVTGAAPGLTVHGTEVTLADDDELPEVVLGVDPASVAEGARATEVTVTAALSNGGTFAVDTAVVVGVGGGTAVAGTDYAAVADLRVVIEAGGTRGTGTFTLAPSDDDVVEGEEWIGVSGSAPGLTVRGAEIGLTDDDEVPEVVLGVAPASVGEGAGATEVTVTAELSGGGTFPADTAVVVSVGGGTATAGTDYAAVADLRVVIEAGKTSGAATFTLAPSDDDVVEGEEWIGVSGSAPGLVVHGAEVALADDDEVLDVNLSVEPGAVAEGAGATEVTVTAELSNGSALPADTTVVVGVGGGTATEGTDYAAVADLRVVIAAGETSGAGTFTLAPSDDDVVEGEEWIGVSGSVPGLTVNGTEVALTDDDEVPEVVLGVEPARVAEGAGATEVTVTAEFSNGSAFAVDTTVVVGVGGGTATAGTDYAAVADLRVVIAAGGTSGTGTFTLAPSDDDVVEGEERIGVSGSAPGLVVHGIGMALADDDEVPEVVLGVEPASVAEGAGATEVTVTAAFSNGSAFAVDTTVTVGVGGGTATEGTDYAAVADLRVVIAAGGTRGTGTFTLAPSDDNLVEGGERIGVSGAVPGLVVHGAEVALADDDEVPEVELGVDPASVAEGAGATEVTVTAAFTNGGAFPVDTAVVVRVGGGTATEGTDYAAVEGFRVVIAAGRTSGAAMFTLVPSDDNLVEGGERIGVSGAVPGLVVHGAEVALADDDEVPEVELGVDPASVAEGAGATEVTVTAAFTNGSAFPVDTAVVVGVGGGTATAGTDYAAVEGFRVVIAAGRTSGAATFTLVPSDDNLVEGGETLPVSGAATGLTVHGTEVALADDDEVPEVELGVDPASVAEGAGATEVTVTAAFSNGSAFPVDTAVAVGVGGGTATAGTDYAAVADLRVVVAAGRTRGTGTFTLVPSDDNVVEGDELIGVSGVATGLTVHGTEVALADDDEVPEVELGVDPASVAEGAGATEVTVTAAFTNGSAFAADTTVVVSVGGGTAGAGTDYAEVEDFEIGIAAGEGSGTATFTLAPSDDNVVEGEERIGVSGAVPGLTVHGAEVALADDDEVPVVVLHPDPASVGEGAPPAEVAVTAVLSNGNTFPEDATVVVTMVGGTATAGADYAEVEDFEIGIPAGGTSGTGTFTLAPEDDDVVEGDETMELSGAVFGGMVAGSGPGLESGDAGDGDVGAPGAVAVTGATMTLVDDDRVATRTRVMELGLARVARTIATQAVDAIGARFEASARISRIGASGDGMAFDPFAVAGIFETGRAGRGVGLPHAGGWGCRADGWAGRSHGRAGARRVRERRVPGARARRGGLRGGALDAVGERGEDRLLGSRGRVRDGRRGGHGVRRGGPAPGFGRGGGGGGVEQPGRHGRREDGVGVVGRSGCAADDGVPLPAVVPRREDGPVGDGRAWDGATWSWTTASSRSAPTAACGWRRSGCAATWRAWVRSVWRCGPTPSPWG